MVGAGGAGGNANTHNPILNGDRGSGGGGGGAATRFSIAVTAGDIFTYAVGSGGAVSLLFPGQGGIGGSTTLASGAVPGQARAEGGAGGRVDVFSGGTGGIVDGASVPGQLAVSGAQGSVGTFSFDGTFYFEMGGNGGASSLGPGGSGGDIFTLPTAGSFPGGGGGGGAGPGLSITAGAGADGAIFITVPSSVFP